MITINLHHDISQNSHFFKAVICAIFQIGWKFSYPLIALSLLIALGFLAAFIWATRDGQYDDDQTPAIRMLHDNHPQNAKTE